MKESRPIKFIDRFQPGEMIFESKIGKLSLLLGVINLKYAAG